jgi:hypothetical protein
MDFPQIRRFLKGEYAYDTIGKKIFWLLLIGNLFTGVIAAGRSSG